MPVASGAYEANLRFTLGPLDVPVAVGQRTNIDRPDMVQTVLGMDALGV